MTNTASGQTNGSINATATGGTPPYTYSLNGGPFQGTGLFSNLAAGSYQITAKTGNGCTGSAQFTVGTINPCAGVVITVTTSNLNATQCAAANGGISVSASGGASPYTYSLNNGAFQVSNVFNALAPNAYSITVKDANGCTQTINTTVSSAPTGPLFNDVKAILATNCALSGCHAGATPQNGIDFTVNCTIVSNNTRIKERAVDGNPSFMPPAPNPQLSAADKQKIVNWVNAGGQTNN